MGAERGSRENFLLKVTFELIWNRDWVFHNGSGMFMWREWGVRAGCIPGPSSRLRARKLPQDDPREQGMQITDKPRVLL